MRTVWQLYAFWAITASIAVQSNVGAILLLDAFLDKLL